MGWILATSAITRTAMGKKFQTINLGKMPENFRRFRAESVKIVLTVNFDRRRLDAVD